MTDSSAVLEDSYSEIVVNVMALTQHFLTFFCGGIYSRLIALPQLRVDVVYEIGGGGGGGGD